jgi:hypothetical protein
MCQCLFVGSIERCDCLAYLDGGGPGGTMLLAVALVAEKPRKRITSTPGKGSNSINSSTLPTTTSHHPIPLPLTTPQHWNQTQRYTKQSCQHHHTNSSS